MVTTRAATNAESRKSTISNGKTRKKPAPGGMAKSTTEDKTRSGSLERTLSLIDKTFGRSSVMKDNGKIFERGSALSIFSSDRIEDFIALILALVIAFFVYITY